MISEEKLNIFFREMVEEYDERSILNSISGLDEYDERLHQNRHFVQIGKRVNLPKRYFYENENVHTKSLYASFIDSLIASERRFIPSSIQEEVQDGELDSFEIDDFNYDTLVRESNNYVLDADHIFLPNEIDYRKTIYDWREDGLVEFKDTSAYIQGVSELEVQWMPGSWDFSNGFVFDSEKVDVVQKRYDDVHPPDYIKNWTNYDYSDEDDRLMIYLGDIPDESDEFDFFHRIVVSEPIFEEDIYGSAAMIKIR